MKFMRAAHRDSMAAQEFHRPDLSCAHPMISIMGSSDSQNCSSPHLCTYSQCLSTENLKLDLASMRKSHCNGQTRNQDWKGALWRQGRARVGVQNCECLDLYSAISIFRGCAGKMENASREEELTGESFTNHNGAPIGLL